MGNFGWIVGGVAYLLVAAAAMYTVPGLAGPIVVVTFIVAAITLGRQLHKRNLARNEALFASMFPDLQPWLHPRQLYDLAIALLEAYGRGPRVLKSPPGFAGKTADIRKENDRELVRILDADGALLTQFTFEPHKEGAAIRAGKGKFTVTTTDKAHPRVRYWHPEREFKWTPLTWQFKTPVADRPFESSDSRSSFSSDSSSSSSTSSRVASAAPFVAAGGTFDGGGASASWSEAGSGSDAGSDSGGGAGVESSAASTSY